MTEASLGKNFPKVISSSMSDTCKVWSFDAYLCPGYRIFRANNDTRPDEEVIFHRGMPESPLLFSCWVP